MVASNIYSNVCMDAGGFGSLLDCIQFVWNITNVYHKENNEIKNTGKNAGVFYSVKYFKSASGVCIFVFFIPQNFFVN